MTLTVVRAPCTAAEVDPASYRVTLSKCNSLRLVRFFCFVIFSVCFHTGDGKDKCEDKVTQAHRETLILRTPSEAADAWTRELCVASCTCVSGGPAVYVPLGAGHIFAAPGIVF